MLIGTAPIIGHVNPFLPLARALVARGRRRFKLSTRATMPSRWASSCWSGLRRPAARFCETKPRTRRM